MFLVNLLVALLLTLTIAPSRAQDAPEVDDNPNFTYTARLGNKDTTTLRGVLTITAAPDGVGVEVYVDFWGFPAAYSGPYGRLPFSSRSTDSGCSSSFP